MRMTTWIWVGFLAVGAIALGFSVQQLTAGCCGGGNDHAVAAVPQPKAGDAGATSQPTTSQPTTAPSNKVVNVRCPIMGNAIDPNKVPDSLTREYNGQKVGFCCGGCPGRWDKLTPEQKDAKLKAAMDSK